MVQILVVDDEADTHLLYKLKFKKIFPNSQDFQLISFLSAKDGLNYLSKNSVDVVLSDINMPGIDGFGFLKEAKKLFPDLTFYMVSAYESTDFRSKAERLGAQRFLSKPVDFHRLGEYLRQDLNLSLE